MKIGQKVRKGYHKEDEVDNRAVDDKENDRWYKAEMLIPIISVASSKLFDQIKNTIK